MSYRDRKNWGHRPHSQSNYHHRPDHRNERQDRGRYYNDSRHSSTKDKRRRSRSPRSPPQHKPKRMTLLEGICAGKINPDLTTTNQEGQAIVDDFKKMIEAPLLETPCAFTPVPVFVLPQSEVISDQLRVARKELENSYQSIKNLDEKIRKAKFMLALSEVRDHNASIRLDDLESRISAYK